MQISHVAPVDVPPEISPADVVDRLNDARDAALNWLVSDKAGSDRFTGHAKTVVGTLGMMIDVLVDAMPPDAREAEDEPIIRALTLGDGADFEDFTERELEAIFGIEGGAPCSA